MAPVDAFLARLAQVIRDERLLPARVKLLVAVSGGLDSMTLLLALTHLRDGFGWRLEVAHFNHHLRGRAADADERFVRRQCTALDVPCHVGHWSAKDRRASVKAGGIEQAARAARRAFLGVTAASIASSHIAVAHHADDQVETFFIRLLRGAGTQGLGGMRKRTKHGPPLRAWLVRPLLDFPRAEIAGWARANGVKYREDASNGDSRFLRNRVRNELLPYLHQHFSPATHRLVLRTMRGLADEADWLRAAAVEYLRTPGNERRLFAKCPPALQRHTLVLQLERRQLKFDSELIETLRTTTDTTITGPGNHELSRDQWGNVEVREPGKTSFDVATRLIALRTPKGAFHFAPLAVEWSVQRRRKPDRFLPQRELFDAARIGKTIQLRHWQAGDRFQPIGMSRSVKLQNLFTNAKVPPTERRRRTVATTARGEIFWVEGLRIGERFKLTPATRQCLVWHWRRQIAGGQFPAERSAANS